MDAHFFHAWVFYTDFSVERYIFDVSDLKIVQNDVDWQPFS